MASSLPRGAPEDQQVDPAAIVRFLDTVEDHPGVEMHSLMVVRHGHVVAEGWWAPYSAERPQLLYSLSKSFTSTAAAFAQAEGLLDLDDTVVSHFGEFAADITDPGSRSVKIRHVASMASGHTREMLDEALARDPADIEHPVPALHPLQVDCRDVQAAAKEEVCRRRVTVQPDLLVLPHPRSAPPLIAQPGELVDVPMSDAAGLPEPTDKRVEVPAVGIEVDA